MSELIMKPGISLGHYPQRPEIDLDDLEAVAKHWAGRLGSRLRRKRMTQKTVARRVKVHQQELENCSDADFD